MVVRHCKVASNHQHPSMHTVSGQHRPTREAPFKWRFAGWDGGVPTLAGGPIVDQLTLSTLKSLESLVKPLLLYAFPFFFVISRFPMALSLLSVDTGTARIKLLLRIYSDRPS